MACSDEVRLWVRALPRSVHFASAIHASRRPVIPINHRAKDVRSHGATTSQRIDQYGKEESCKAEEDISHEESRKPR